MTRRQKKLAKDATTAEARRYHRRLGPIESRLTPREDELPGVVEQLIRDSAKMPSFAYDANGSPVDDEEDEVRRRDEVEHEDEEDE